jgi:hypothetical protein
MRTAETKSIPKLARKFNKTLLSTEIQPIAKFNQRIERQVEQLLRQSRALGWSHPDFVTYLMEVLVVVRHRSSARPDSRLPKSTAGL